MGAPGRNEAPIAQWIERRTSDPLVAGSTPARRAMYYFIGGSLAQLVEQRTLNPWVAGSSPAGPTIFYDDETEESARVAELEDALDLGSSGETHAGSSPALRTIFILERGRKMEYKVKEKTETKIVFETKNNKEEIENAKRQAYKKLIKNVRVPGFRQGKAPYEIGLPFVGSGRLLEEATDILLQKNFDELLKKENVNPVVQPEVKIDKITEDELVCTFTVEFLPEVKVNVPEKIEVPFKIEDIEKEVDGKIKELQKTFTEIKPVERPVKEGDLVELQYRFKNSKNTEWKSVTVEAVKNQFVGDFDQKIVGKKKGDEFEVKYKDTVIEVKVVSVKEKNVPEIDDELAKDAGFENLEDMKNKIKEEAIKNRKLQAEESKGDEALNILAKELNVELPEKLVDNETKRRIEDLRNQYLKHGVKIEDLLASEKKTMEDFEKDVREGVITDIKRDLIIQAIIKQNDIKVEDKEIQEEFDRFLKDQGLDKGRVKINDNIRNVIEDQILRKKVISFLKERAIIKEEGDD